MMKGRRIVKKKKMMIMMMTMITEVKKLVEGTVTPDIKVM